MAEALMRKVDGQGNHISVVDDAKWAGLLVVIDRPNGTQVSKQVADRAAANSVITDTVIGPDGLEFAEDT
jgi:hypothetical protein